MPTSPIRTTSKSAVVGQRVGREHHPAAVPHAVRDDDVVHAAAPLVAVGEPHGHLGVRPLQEHPREGVEERGAAAECLRHAVDALGDGAAHPDGADVREPALLVSARPGPVAHPARVDGSGRALERHADGVVEPRRDAVGAHEVHAGADRDRRELDPPAGDAVDGLVERAVAADRDDERGSVVGRTARQLDQVAGPLGEEGLAGETESLGAVGELRPAVPGTSVVGRRVDQEDGPVSQRSRRRVRSSSSGRPRPGARRRRSA